jgi:hypothetical protein
LKIVNIEIFKTDMRVLNRYGKDDLDEDYKPLRDKLREWYYENMTLVLRKEVRDWEDVVNISICYLDGKLPSSPWYMGPLEEETGIILHELKDLHKTFGLVSIESQPGMYSVNNNDCSEFQRPYLDCILNSKNLNMNQLVDEFKKANLLFQLTLFDLDTKTNQYQHYTISNNDEIINQSRFIEVGVKHQWEKPHQDHPILKPFTMSKHGHYNAVPTTIFMENKTVTIHSRRRIDTDIFKKGVEGDFAGIFEAFPNLNIQSVPHLARLTLIDMTFGSTSLLQTLKQCLHISENSE